VCADEAGMVVMSAFNREGEQQRPLAGRFDGTDAAGGVRNAGRAAAAAATFVTKRRCFR
jgi:hypothetical protein